MPRKCCVLGCTSNYRTKVEKYITVFLFPKDPHRRQQWVRAIHRDNYEPGSHAVVCVKHFSEQHLVRVETATRDDGSILVVPRKSPKLTEDACPSVFPTLPPYLSLEPTLERKDAEERRGEMSEKDAAVFCAKRTSKLEEIVSVKSEPVWPDENSHLEVELKGEYESEPHVWVKQEVLIKEEVQETDEDQPSYSDNSLFAEEDLEIVKDEVEDSYKFSDVKSDLFRDEDQLSSGKVTEQGSPDSEEYPKGYSDLLSNPSRSKTNSRKCDVSSKTFNRRSYLKKRSEVIHVDERKFSCSQSSKCFKVPGNLKRHVAHVHEAEKFPCPQCSVRFKSSSGLKKHLDGHIGEKIYKVPLRSSQQLLTRKETYYCNLCLEEFFDRDQLVRHRNEHLEKQDYRCTICLKELNSRNGLVSHMSKAHSEGKSFQCTFCSKRYAYFGFLMKHTQSDHQFMMSDTSKESK